MYVSPSDKEVVTSQLSMIRLCYGHGAHVSFGDCDISFSGNKELIPQAVSDSTGWALGSPDWLGAIGDMHRKSTKL